MVFSNSLRRSPLVQWLATLTHMGGGPQVKTRIRIPSGTPIPSMHSEWIETPWVAIWFKTITLNTRRVLHKHLRAQRAWTWCDCFLPPCGSSSRWMNWWREKWRCLQLRYSTTGRTVWTLPEFLMKGIDDLRKGSSPIVVYTGSSQTRTSRTVYTS